MANEPPEWDRVAELAELGVLTASLLHELRQPLFAVKGRIQLARHRNEALQGEQLAEMLQQLSHIDELLDYYAGFGRLQEPPAPLDLREPVRRAVAMLAHRARQVGAAVHTDLGAAPIVITGRAMALRQVVVNLLQNALDAVEGREERRVRVEVSADTHARLLVADTGPGVPEVVLARIFEPFVTTKPAGHGTGLGLYIARKLIEEACGTLAVEIDGGTRVTVTLPV